jgi:transcriptional regulator with PAS, ATPase and Fis domain/polyferredoxin
MANKLSILENEIEDILKFLQEVPIFEELTTESLKKITEKIQKRTFAKDDIIIKNESPGECLYLIGSGSVRVVSESEGEEFLIATIPGGKCFGEMSLLTDELCCATVKTNEDSLLYFITKSDFNEIISENPVIYKHFNKLLSERVHKQNTKSIDIKKHGIAVSRHLQKAKEYQYNSIVWKSKKMRGIVQEASNLSEKNVHITVIGKPGTGKEILSRKIHIDSTRAKFPVFEIALPKERRMLRSPVQNERREHDHTACELFGMEKTLNNGEGDRIGCLELVNNGTIIIKNIENMPLNTQESFLEFVETAQFLKIGGSKPVHSNVRIIVTTTDISLMQKQLNPGLFEHLSAHKLEIPPLSTHKKDIPSLMEHFVNKVSKIRHTQAKKFSKKATNKLLKYDYPGNVKELENVIERAITLSSEDSDIINEEEVFLGDDTSLENQKCINLLKIPLIRRLCESHRSILVAKIVVLAVFISILCFLITQSHISIGERNITLILCWQLGFPFLFVSYLFAGRFSCGICPLNTISKFLNKRVNLKITIPGFIKEYGTWICGIGFMSILFLEKYTHMSHSVNKTAYLIFSILFAAIIFDFIFEKSAWCRYICPLGGMGGLFSMSSMIEIRSNRNVCSTICTTHDCYKGTKKTASCPMSLHLQFLSDNRDCKVCLNCIKNCTHQATRLNLRIPGAEIITLKQPSLAGALLSIMLSGLLAAGILSSTQSINQVNFPLIFAASIFVALTLNLASNYFTALVTKEKAIEHFKHFGYTYIPLILFGFISLNAIDLFGNAEGFFILLNIYKVNFNFTTVFQFLSVLTGLFITEYLIYRIIQNKITKNRQFRAFAIQGIVPLIFSIIYIMLFYNNNYSS